MRADDRRVEVVHDARDHVGVLDRGRDAVAVVDEEREAADDEQPARDERNLRDEARVGVLVRDQEAQADVDERPHEQADRDLGDPVLEEAVEQARSEQRRDHRQHEQRDREDQREHRRDGAHHRRQDRARVVDAAHRQPGRDVDDPVLVEDVGDQRQAEEADGARATCASGIRHRLMSRCERSLSGRGASIWLSVVEVEGRVDDDDAWPAAQAQRAPGAPCRGCCAGARGTSGLTTRSGTMTTMSRSGCWSRSCST